VKYFTEFAIPNPVTAYRKKGAQGDLPWLQGDHGRD
jgi:hypothetical protein